MTGAILWKEFREQGPIGLALLAFGSAVLVLAATQGSPGEGLASGDVLRFLGLGRLATLMLAVTAGMVCGGAVFAAERESGTMAFLESLPVTHRRLWRSKLVAGGCLTIAEAGALLIAATFLGLVPTVTWAVAVLLYSLLAFVWGMFGSTAARTTLGSVGYAIPAAAVCAFLTVVPVLLFFHRPGSVVPKPQGGAIFLAVMFAVPLLMSSYLFTRADRQRAGGPKSKPPVGYPAMLWLSFRQGLIPALVMAVFATILGLALSVPDAQPFVLWPVVALAAGSLTGVLAFADEQTNGAARFWAEQRLPLGRAWMMKIGCQLALCLGLLVVLAIPLAVRSQFHPIDVHGMTHSHAILSIVFGTQVFDAMGGAGWSYLVVSAVYGFAAGHLCGLVFRKLVVAWAVAALVGGTGAVLWLPSLLAGGVRSWQLWLPPAVALLTGRLVLRAWSSDRLLRRRPLAALAGGGFAAFLVQAAGIGYRVLEVPDRPGGEDDIGYVAGLMPFEENLGGREFKTAAERFAMAAAPWTAHFDKLTAEPPPPQPNKNRPQRLDERVEQVLAVGWPKNDRNLEAWLDKVFEKPAAQEDGGWQGWVASAVRRPLGMYEHPQMISATVGVGKSLDSAKRMSFALLARGLQQQARGNVEAFGPAFQAVMMLARSMRNGTVLSCLTIGNEIERYALSALDRWLEVIDPTDSRLALVPAAAIASQREALARTQLRTIASLVRTLEAADPQTPFDPTPMYLAERHLTREALRAPTYSLPSQLGIPVDAVGPTDAVVELISMAWAVPWEKERTRRLVGYGFESGEHLDSAIEGRPGKNYLMARGRLPVDLIAIDTSVVAYRRASLLKLALTAFRLASGSYPKSLDALLPAGYLSRLPVDPYDRSRGFGYRISPPGGDTLKPPPRTPGERSMMTIVDTLGDRYVPAGQAILWSVGPDKVDQGGVNVPLGIGIVLTRPCDVVFLVPMPK